MEIAMINGKPAVNVKIYGWDLMEKAMQTLMAEEGRNPRFSAFYENLSEKDQNFAWEEAITIGWDRLEEIAKDIFGSVTVYSEGRSGGWAVVGGLENPEDWEEEDFKKWREWEEQADTTVEDIPYLTLELIYNNEFEQMLDVEEYQTKLFIANLNTNQLVTE